MPNFKRSKTILSSADKLTEIKAKIAEVRKKLQSLEVNQAEGLGNLAPFQSSLKYLRKSSGSNPSSTTKKRIQQLQSEINAKANALSLSLLTQIKDQNILKSLVEEENHLNH